MKRPLRDDIAKTLEKEGLTGPGIDGGLKVVSGTEAWLGQMGGAWRLVFTRGGSVQVVLNTAEVLRILDALGAIEQKRRKPNAKLREALREAANEIGGPRRSEITLQLTVPMGVSAVHLTPVLPVIGPAPHGWDKE